MNDPSAPRRVLIAGCGYVGLALAEHLHNAPRQHELHGLRRDTRALPGFMCPVQADLNAPSLPQALPAGDFDAVIFCAAAKSRDAGAYERLYVDGLRGLLSALQARGCSVGRLLFTSSTGVYGQDDGSWVDEDSPAAPGTAHGDCLLEAERLAWASPWPATVLRFGGIYGPGRTTLLNRLRSGAVPMPAGAEFTNRLHRDDCAGALAHLAALPAALPLYLGVDDDPADKRDILRWLGVTAPSAGTAEPTGKRCRNGRLRASGFALAYPTFREGYRALLGA